MSEHTIIVPVDGASNIKLEVFDFETLECINSVSAPTPISTVGGLAYNDTGTEFAWFEDMIRSLPERLRHAAVVAPVARGASGGLVGHDDTLCEEPGEELALAYTQQYPGEVEDRFRDIAGSPEAFFAETGSIRDFPGSLTLLKRFVFEEIARPDVLARAAAFATYGALMTGRFIGDYLHAWRVSGNEHSYWMCHTGARDIRNEPGTPSAAARRIPSFARLVPPEPSVAYRTAGTVPENRARMLGIPTGIPVTPGGHDTCLSHIPVMATFFGAVPALRGKPVIQVEAGSWTLVARIGGRAVLPPDGWRRDVIVQGTVDGEPVVTARYGGGNDFKEAKRLIEMAGGVFQAGHDEDLLRGVAERAESFVIPNLSSANHGTGPFPGLRGRIMNERALAGTPGAAHAATSIATALSASMQVAAVADDPSTPLVITAGGAKDPYYGRLIATFTGRALYAPFDREGAPLSETTSLGAAIAGKAAVLGIHPYGVDTSELGVSYRKVEPYQGTTAQALESYRTAWTGQLGK